MLQFYAYTNGRAIAVNNHKNMMTIFQVSLAPAILLSVIAMVTYPQALLVIWLLPVMFLIVSYVVLLFEKYDEDVFLQGQKKKHLFSLENGKFFKNGKEMKQIKRMSLYKYRNEMLLVFNGNHFYLIPNDAYMVGSRETFLRQVTFTRFHEFVLKAVSE